MFNMVGYGDPQTEISLLSSHYFQFYKNGFYENSLLIFSKDFYMQYFRCYMLYFEPIR